MLPQFISTPGSDLYENPTGQVLSEIQCVNLVIYDGKTCGCNPKARQGVRLIHDCSGLRVSMTLLNMFKPSDEYFY